MKILVLLFGLPFIHSPPWAPQQEIIKEATDHANLSIVNPMHASLMIYGTLDGQVIVINHESERIVLYFLTWSNELGLC